MSKKRELRADLNRIGSQLGGAHLTQDAGDVATANCGERSAHYAYVWHPSLLMGKWSGLFPSAHDAIKDACHIQSGAAFSVSS